MYVPLGVQTSYSFLTSTIKISELIKREFECIALLDEHNLHGAFEFCQLCKKNNKKAIIGSFLNIEGGIRLAAYCENQEGYENLSWLITNSNIRGTQHIEWSDFENHSSGILIITDPYMKMNSLQILKHNLLKYFSNRCYAGVMLPNMNIGKKISLELDISIIALPISRYLHSQDMEAHNALRCTK